MEINNNKNETKFSNNAENFPKKKKFVESWTFVILVCVILPMCFRGFLYSPRHIPSSSMKPTLLIGDYVFISKFEYGFSKYSFPFGYKINYFDGRTKGSMPARGDIIVFRPPMEPSTDFIKRLIGLPGDHIQIKNGKLYLNGQMINQKRMSDFYDEREDGTTYPVKRYMETLPNNISFEVLDAEENGRGDNTKEFIVPEGHYFFMGDNRDNSEDSRFSVGYVPYENLVGKAELVFFSNKSSFIKLLNWLVSFRVDRFFIDITNNNTAESVNNAK